MEQQPSQSTISPQAVTVATIKNKATVVLGEVGSMSVEVMFDSGSAVSLLRKRDVVKITVQVDSFETEYEFVVVESLIYPVILGIDSIAE